VYLFVDPGFLSPLNYYEASRFVPPSDERPCQTQQTKRKTNGRTDGRTEEETRLFVRPPVRPFVSKMKFDTKRLLHL